MRTLLWLIAALSVAGCAPPPPRSPFLAWPTACADRGPETTTLYHCEGAR